jgi:hypothetical protein
MTGSLAYKITPILPSTLSWVDNSYRNLRFCLIRWVLLINQKLFNGFFTNLSFMIRSMASLLKIIAVGETFAEDFALQWAADHGVSWCRSCLEPKSNAVVRERFGKQRRRSLECLRQNTIDSDSTFLLSLSFALYPEQKKVLEFLGTRKKPFLHLWSSVPQPGLLARLFLKRYQVKVLNVVGCAEDRGDAIQTFVRSVFETALLPAET